MKLFSEKVTPTFTSSNQNILTIKGFTEIFFDVYELEINGNKYIAEKISEYKGNPVVNIPVVIDGKEFEAPFVLQTGKFDIIFNERNSTFVGNVKPEVVEVYNESKSQEEEVEEIIFEKRESILEEIQQARQLATKFAEDIKQEKIRAADVRISKDKAAVINTANKFKSELIDEFLALTENTREELYTYTQEENKKSYDFIVETVTQLADKLTQDLNQEVGIQTANSISVFEEKIDNLAKNILTNKLLKTISQNNVENDKKINLKFETVSKTIAKVLGDYEVQLNEDVKLKLENFDSQILTLEKNSVELNNTIIKNTNKALSRIGNVKTQLEEAVVNVSVTLSEELTSKITLAESKIKDYYDERITLVESSITDITAQERAHILNVIQESKQSILEEVSKIKTSVPSVIAEKTREPKGEADIQKIKTDLEKTISNRFTQELANVRRIIELSSGGGSVAVQFANGGIMNGNLVITGNTTTNTLTVNSGSNITGGLSADRIYTTQLDALSANITVIDIKQYELSGFNVQGDCTIQGNVSASGSVTANNLVYKGGNTEGAALTVGTNDAQDLNFETNGTSRMIITSAGAVGFGTPPTIQSGFTFEVAGQSKFANQLYLGSNLRMFGSTPLIAGDNLRFTNGNSVEIMRLSTNGNVGIGTTTPNEKLTVVGNISATGDIRSNGNIIANGDDKYNTSYNLISADDVYIPNQIEIFNDFIQMGTNNFATFINLTGASGSAGNSFSDGSPADIYINQPTGDDRFASRGVMQLQTPDAFNTAFAFVPSFSIFSGLAGYYTSNTAYRVYIARNDSDTYIRFGVQPALGGEYGASAYFTQRTLVMDTSVSPNFFFANCTGARTYVTSTSADTGIPALTGMWVNIHQDFNVTNVNTLTSIDLTVNYTRDSLKYTYQFLPGSVDRFVSIFNNYAKKQGGGILFGQQATVAGGTRRKALLIDWWYLKTTVSPLCAGRFPANWNSQRFTK